MVNEVSAIEAPAIHRGPSTLYIQQNVTVKYSAYICCNGCGLIGFLLVFCYALRERNESQPVRKKMRR